MPVHFSVNKVARMMEKILFYLVTEKAYNTEQLSLNYLENRWLSHVCMFHSSFELKTQDSETCNNYS